MEDRIGVRYLISDYLHVYGKKPLFPYVNIMEREDHQQPFRGQGRLSQPLKPAENNEIIATQNKAYYGGVAYSNA